MIRKLGVDAMIQVIEVSRSSRVLYEGGPLGCIQYCHGIARDGMTRLGMIVPACPLRQGPDLLVCVPLRGYDDWLTRALELVVAWDDQWLLVESMPHRFREEARDELARSIADALLAAAMAGVNAAGGCDAGNGDLPF